MANVSTITDASDYYGAQIDMDRIVSTIERRAVAGLNITLTEVTFPHAVKHAPVRAFIRKAPRPRGRNLTSLAMPKNATTASIMRRFRAKKSGFARPHKSGSDSADFSRFSGSRPKVRRINVPAPNMPFYDPTDEIAAGHFEHMRRTIPAEGRVEGHRNSFKPVVRFTEGGAVHTQTGDFRRVSGGQFMPVAYADRVTGGRASIIFPPAPVKVGKNLVTAPSPVNDLLTTRARYDVKNGRIKAFAAGASFYGKRAELRRRRGLHTDKGGVTRYGGTLRDSITTIKASLEMREGNNKVYGYVRAGGNGIDYASYQEFGTGHNRPHPYLRPALYESRQSFRTRVRSSLGGVDIG